MSENRLKATWADGGSAVGAWCTLGSAFAAELCAQEGFDYVCIDLQHGLVHFDTMAASLMAVSRTGVTPLVRVPGNETYLIGKALDAGAEGVIVPMVNSREEAERAVRACRYGPDGHRSFGPIRSGFFLNAAVPLEVNRQVLCIVMIETIGAVQRAAEICSTPGVDAVYVGPADLAITMGEVPTFGTSSPEHQQAIHHVLTTCNDQRLVAGIHTGGGSQARAYLDMGFRMATVSTDSALLRTAHREQLASARGGHSSAGTSGST